MIAYDKSKIHILFIYFPVKKLQLLIYVLIARLDIKLKDVFKVPSLTFLVIYLLTYENVMAKVHWGQEYTLASNFEFQARV